MANEEEIKKHAQEAEAMAERSINELEKASWLRIAQGWLSMLPYREKSANGASEGEGGSN
jgi:hypothetical protein